MKNNIKNIQILVCLSTFLVLGCSKFIEVEAPNTSISEENIYNNDATAIGAVTALYSVMSSGSILATSQSELTSLSCIVGLSADELDLIDNTSNIELKAYYENNLTDLYPGNYWDASYRKIFVVNSALQKLEQSTLLNPAVKKQLLGEVSFMRAFYYFYLVNLYGDVPLVLTTDYTTNALVKRTPKAQVYDQIIVDLKKAQDLLSDKYLRGDVTTIYANGAEEKTRPTKWAAKALLARVYLYINNWADAVTESTSILENTAQFGLESLDQVFLKNNKEAIWQLQSVDGFNTGDARSFVLPSNGPSDLYPVYLAPNFLLLFDSSDRRKENWINSVDVDGKVYYYPFKYKVAEAYAPVVEYNTVFRLAEQFLIRAEALAQLGNLTGAISDIDEIRGRAGLDLLADVNPAISQAELLIMIQEENRIEFFSEWGHRWFDLKRTNSIDDVMENVTPQKSHGEAWRSYQQYFPFNVFELRNNPNLVQNPGY